MKLVPRLLGVSGYNCEDPTCCKDCECYTDSCYALYIWAEAVVVIPLQADAIEGSSAPYARLIVRSPGVGAICMSEDETDENLMRETLNGELEGLADILMYLGIPWNVDYEVTMTYKDIPYHEMFNCIDLKVGSD